jgi:hypothetical protein
LPEQLIDDLERHGETLLNYPTTVAEMVNLLADPDRSPIRHDDAGRQGANADHFAPEDVTTAAKETAVVWVDRTPSPVAEPNGRL